MLEPSALTTVAQKTIAQKPTFGGEEILRVASGLPTEPAEYEILGANSGLLSVDSAEAATLLAAPQELIAVLELPVKAGGSNVVLTVVGTDPADGALTGVFTFKVPAWARNQERVFPVGYAAGAVSTVDGTKFKTITSASVTCAADATGAKITLFGVPSLSTFTQVGCRTQSNFTTKSRVPKAIACQMDGSAHTKLGMSEPGTLEFTTKHVSFGDGLAKFDGVRATYILDNVKEGQVLVERVIFLNTIIKVKPEVPDGEGEMMTPGSGIYEDAAILVAK